MNQLIWNLARSYFFRQDAEHAHETVLSFLKRLQLNPRQEESLDNAKRYLFGALSGKESTHVPVTISGMTFRNPVGLAAGFDKNGEVLGAVAELGFGFAEIGTVTPRAQPGNPKPRMFRDVKNKALFNCLGFNNDGAEVVAERLKMWRASGALPKDFRIGINFGKNRATSQEEAHKDYALAAKLGKDSADYAVVNVSSPNTPGLRDLQTKKLLIPILTAVSEQLAIWKHKPPLFLKLAPEMTAEQLEELIPAAEKAGCEAFILTNTLAGTFEHEKDTLKGGWSGAPLQKMSIECFHRVRMLTHKPIIGVGGIMTVDDAVERIRMGAQLIQVYTGWVYHGPSFARELVKKLSETKL